jgi:hypothetical protein
MFGETWWIHRDEQALVRWYGSAACGGPDCVVMGPLGSGTLTLSRVFAQARAKALHSVDGHEPGIVELEKGYHARDGARLSLRMRSLVRGVQGHLCLLVPDVDRLDSPAAEAVAELCGVRTATLFVTAQSEALWLRAPARTFIERRRPRIVRIDSAGVVHVDTAAN